MRLPVADLDGLQQQGFLFAPAGTGRPEPGPEASNGYVPRGFRSALLSGLEADGAVADSLACWERP